MKKLLILIGVLFIFIHHSQAYDDLKQQRIDSLQNVVETASHDSSRIKALIKLAMVRKDSLELAIDYTLQALDLGKKLNNPEAMARIHQGVSRFYASEGIVQKAVKYALKAYHYYKNNNKPKKLINVIQQLTNIYFNIGNKEKHQLYDKEGLKIARQQKDTTHIVVFLNGLGLVASQNQQKEEALKHYNEALALEETTKNKSMLTTLLNNIGMAYNASGEYDKALKYLFKSIKIAKTHKEHFIKIYQKYGANKEEAKGGFRFGLGNTYINIGTAYKNKKEYEKAVEYSNKGIELIKKSKKERIFYQYQKVYNTLSKAYEGQSNVNLAYKNFKLYIAARDSMKNLNHEQQLNKVVSKHIAEKKEKEVQTLKREAEITSQRNRAINTALGGGLFLMLSLAGLIYKRYDEKRKSHNVLEEQNHEITAQNHEISAQRDQIVEKSQKLEYAYHNITDSIEYAQCIQEALLPSQAVIQKALPESMVMLKPRDKVSGDFYWFAQTGNEAGAHQKTVLAAVDCTGHGVPGAFMSMAGDAYLNQIVKQQGITKPDEILCKLHKNIRQALKQETTGNRDGMDISLVTIDQENKVVNFAGAKNPLIYIQNGTLHLIKGDKYSIGGEQREGKRSFTPHSIAIDSTNPTAFYLFSDGFQDQFGGSEGKKFMVGQFRDLLLSIHQLPMEVQKARLEQTFQEWLGNKYEQIDDVLVMGFKA